MGGLRIQPWPKTCEGPNKRVLTEEIHSTYRDELAENTDRPTNRLLSSWQALVNTEVVQRSTDSIDSVISLPRKNFHLGWPIFTPDQALEVPILVT